MAQLAVRHYAWPTRTCQFCPLLAYSLQLSAPAWQRIAVVELSALYCSWALRWRARPTDILRNDGPGVDGSPVPFAVQCFWCRIDVAVLSHHNTLLSHGGGCCEEIGRLCVSRQSIRYEKLLTSQATIAYEPGLLHSCNPLIWLLRLWESVTQILCDTVRLLAYEDASAIQDVLRDSSFST